MHYASIGTRPDPTHTLKQRIRHEVLPQIGTTHWKGTGQHLPLRHRTDFNTVLCCALPHADGRRSHSRAVYVVECVDTANPREVACRRLKKTIKHEWPDKGHEAHRRIYVGRSKSVAHRLHQHVSDDPEEGADFTQVFQPVRILNITFYRHRTVYHRAERLTAELLQQELSDTYVHQA
jgi:predicted GIY-YIG superfamily endonuclease